jgi:hypothetical protein
MHEYMERRGFARASMWNLTDLPLIPSITALLFAEMGRYLPSLIYVVFAAQIILKNKEKLFPLWWRK